MSRVPMFYVRYICDVPGCFVSVDVIGPEGRNSPPDWYWWVDEGNNDRQHHFHSVEHAEEFAGLVGKHRVQPYERKYFGEVVSQG